MESVTMERILKLDARPQAVLEIDSRRLVLGLADGLAVWDGNSLTYLDRGLVQGAARAADGSCYWTRDGEIVRWDPSAAAAPQQVTARFAGRPQGRQLVHRTGSGELWIEGCATRLVPGNRFLANPAAPAAAWPPAAWDADIYGNLWTLAADPRGAQVLVAPASAPQEWQVSGLPAGQWTWLGCDCVGYVWVAGPAGWRRFCPRHAERGWVVADGPLAGREPTAMGRSPADLVMAALNDGDLVELDATADDQALVRTLGRTPQPARCLRTDRGGGVWAATEEALYRGPAASGAWQRTWTELRGRLPGGGNHDIFATPCQGRLYVAGGWAGQWGLPVRDHVPDALLALDPQTECWETVGRMYMPRRYNGIATLDGRVWIVGGETRFAGRGGPHQALDLVDIYDPASGAWTTGPSLNHVRTDPFVVACDGRLWAIGGARHNGGPKLDTVESIGPGDDAWREEAPLPQPTRQGHACVLDHVVYCFSIDGAFAYDTRAGRWDEHLPQPGPIGQGPLAAAWRGEVWLIGGYQDRSIRCFDPVTRTWHAGPDLPTEQAWAAAAVLDGRLYVVGGAHYSQAHQAIVFDDRVFRLRAGELAR